MTAVNQYEIYCFDEEAWIKGWNEEPITKCPNVDTHNVNLDSVRQIATLSRNEIGIRQEDVMTGRRIRISTIHFEVLAGQTVTYDHSFPINISLLGGSTKTIETQKDDLVTIQMGPNTTIGTITSDAAQDTTTIVVSSTVMDNIFVGGYVNLTNGTDVSNNSQVLAIDTNTNTLTLETPLDMAFVTGDFVRLTVIAVDNVRVSHAGSRTFATRSLVGRSIPANTILRFIYTNNSADTQTPTMQFEYFY